MLTHLRRMVRGAHLRSPGAPKLTLVNLRANPVRFIATMPAIIVGTGFLAATLVLGDSLSTALAHKMGWAVGDTLQLATTSGQKPVGVVGFTRYATQPASGANGDIVVSQADAFEFLTSNGEAYDSIHVKADPGVSPDIVTANLPGAVIQVMAVGTVVTLV